MVRRVLTVHNVSAVGRPLPLYGGRPSEKLGKPRPRRDGLGFLVYLYNLNTSTATIRWKNLDVERRNLGLFEPLEH